MMAHILTWRQGGYDTYEGKLDDCIRRATQWPMTDPTIPIAAMAAVTKNLAFAITGTTSFEQPFVLAKRYATLDHLTNGRFGWNIVTGYKKAAFKAIGFGKSSLGMVSSKTLLIIPNDR